MQIEAALEQFAQHSQLRGVGPRTLGEYRKRLARWVKWRAGGEQIEDVSLTELREFFSYLSERTPYAGAAQRAAQTGRRLSASYILTIYQTIRIFWYWCEGEGLLTTEQITFFRKRRVPSPRVEEQIRPTYDDQVFAALLDACEQPRDRAVLLMLAESGARVAELCSVEWENTDFERRESKIRGKGGRWRWLFWGEQAAAALAGYLATAEHTSGPLIRSEQGGGLTTNCVRLIFRRLADRAGVELPAGAPVHALRHTFAHKVLDAGIDGLHLSQLLGHTTLRMTLRYTREHPSRLRDIHGRIFKP